MIAVYTFTRSDNEILQALLNVFSSGLYTAKEQWSLETSVHIEPTGWSALWKLSKYFCGKFRVRFPCVAFIMVKDVNCDDLLANVEVLSVQHPSLTLPDKIVDVPLIELWPSIDQSIDVDIEVTSTANCIDLMRFFYDNIWMPCDDQDNKILLPKLIQDRMTLWMQLNNGEIPKYIARSITLLRTSMINAHHKLQELNLSLSEGKEDGINIDDSLLSPYYLTQCGELNASVEALMSKWTLYENPILREQYLIKTMTKIEENRSNKNIVALWKGGNMSELKNITNFMEGRVTDEQTVTITTSAEEALSLEANAVVICSKEYEIPLISLSHIELCSLNGAVNLKSAETRTCLLMLGDECQIYDMTLHCFPANTVIVMLAGSLYVKNCTLLDDSTNSQYDFAQGVVAMTGANIILEDCTFQNFYSGIVVHKGAKLEVRNSTIKQCGVGVQMYSGAQVKFYNVTIEECTEECIRCEMDDGSVETEMVGLEMINCRISKTMEEPFIIL